jgi:hypothetical protein
MTDRLKGVVVTFDRDIREDDAQEIINAIKMIRGVLAVDQSVADYDDHMNRARIEREYKQKVWDAIFEPKKGV